LWGNGMGKSWKRRKEMGIEKEGGTNWEMVGKCWFGGQRGKSGVLKKSQKERKKARAKEGVGEKGERGGGGVVAHNLG